MLINLKKWMRNATTSEQEELAGIAGTSRSHLYHVANGLSNASSKLAAEVEVASAQVSRKSKGRLEPLTRADISSVCAECPYAKRCLKGNTQDK